MEQFCLLAPLCNSAFQISKYISKNRMIQKKRKWTNRVNRKWTSLSNSAWRSRSRASYHKCAHYRNQINRRNSGTGESRYWCTQCVQRLLSSAPSSGRLALKWTCVTTHFANPCYEKLIFTRAKQWEVNFSDFMDTFWQGCLENTWNGHGRWLSKIILCL